MKNAAMEKQIKNAAMSAAAMAAVMAAAASARAEQQLKNAAAAAAVADALVAQKRLKNAAVSVTGASASQEAAAAVVAAQMAKLHLERAAENAALKQIKNAQAAAAVATAAVAAAVNNLRPITLRPETLPSDEAHRVVLLFCNNGGWEAVKNLPLIDGRSILVRDLLQNVEEIPKLFYQTQTELGMIKEQYSTNTNVNKLSQLAKNIENKTAEKTLLYQVMSWLQLCNAKKQKKQKLESLFAGIKKVDVDGWCFYHSIITDLENSSNKEKAIKLSHEVVQWLRDNRSTRLSNGQTIEERYDWIIGDSIIPIYNSRYGSSRALSMDEYLFYSGKETVTMLPVVWPELAIVGYAIANLKNVQLIIYSDQTGEPTASYTPFQTRPTKVVSLWHSDNNHFDLLVPRV